MRAIETGHIKTHYIKNNRTHTSPSAIVMICGVKPDPAEPANHSPVETQLTKKLSHTNLAVYVGIKRKQLKVN